LKSLWSISLLYYTESKWGKGGILRTKPDVNAGEEGQESQERSFNFAELLQSIPSIIIINRNIVAMSFIPKLLSMATTIHAATV